MNFGSAAQNYANHRLGFPDSFFEKVPLRGVVLDLGAGTGTLAKGYAVQGCFVCAVDVSTEMLAHARGPFVKIVARAEEALPSFADETFDHVVVGQAWHWFDAELAAHECFRVLKPNGTLTLASLDYRLAEGNIATRTEALIVQHNPSWPLAGSKTIRGSACNCWSAMDSKPSRENMMRISSIQNRVGEGACRPATASWPWQIKSSESILIVSWSDS
jgi:SAM-dependent methyltransferase